MKPAETQLVIDRYNKRLSQFGHDPRTLGWTKRKEDLRFHVLLSHWNLRDSTILDFGCGFGDMSKYCEKVDSTIRYAGVDINAQLIAEGKKCFPGADLLSLNAFEEGLPGQYDYIFSSGVHNFKLEDNWRFIRETFALFDKHAKKGFALNFLSNRVEYALIDTYHADPVRIVALAYSYSNRVTLRNDYMPFEFTVFIDKETGFDKNYTVYPDFMRFVTP